MIRWLFSNRHLTSEATVVTYHGAGTDLRIQSRKRYGEIKPAYVVMKGKEDLHAFKTLEEAEQFAEEVHNGKSL